MRSADPLALLDLMLATAHVTGLAREHVEAVQEIRQALICERCRLSPAERGSLPRMPDVPGSGPPDPDTTERLAAVISALQAGAPPAGLHVSNGIARALLSSPISRNEILVGGVAHLLHEVPFGSSGSWAYLSPAVV